MARSVILYSGGMDSFCLSKMVPEADLLFIETGTGDNQHEKLRLPDYVKQVKMNLSAWELENKIIPFRNCFFVLAAAQMYSDIYLGATAGDTTKDKDYVFKAMMESMMNYFGLDDHKMGHTARPFIIHMPFKNKTKTEIVKLFLEYGNDPISLAQESRSCYEDSHDQECGRCRACLRKFIAFFNNDIQSYIQFQHEPSKLELEAFLLESQRKGRGREAAEIEFALLKYK